MEQLLVITDQPALSQEELQEQSKRMTSPEVLDKIDMLTNKMGMTKEYVQYTHLERANDESRSEKSQDHNLDKLGETVGAYKLNEEQNTSRILNVTNVLNILTSH